MAQPIWRRLLALSIGLYRLLVYLYPRAHRKSLGPWMIQLFRDMARDELAERGALGLVGLWGRTLPDLGHSLVVEHHLAWSNQGLGGLAMYQQTSWGKVFLAVLPGLFVVVGLNQYLVRWMVRHGLPDGATWWVVPAVALALLVAGLVYERRLADWMLVPLGNLVVTLPALFAQWGQATGTVVLSRWAGSLLLLVLLLAPLGALAIIAKRFHGMEMPRWAWPLLALLVLWMIVHALWPVGGMGAERGQIVALVAWVGLLGLMLFPIWMAILLAPHSGARAILLALPLVYSQLAAGVLDPSYALGIWTGDARILTVVRVLPALTLLVITPVWVLRARSPLGQAWGLLLPPAAALIIAQMLADRVRPYIQPGIGNTLRLGAILLPLPLLLALAAAFYDALERSTQADWL